VRADVVSNAEAFPADHVDVAAFQLVSGRKADGVHGDVQRIPVLAEARGQRFDFLIAGDVQRQHDVRAEFPGELLDARLELVADVGEREFRALTAHRLGDAPRDRTVGRESGYQRALALEKTHLLFPSADQVDCLVTSTRSVSFWPGRR